MSVCCTVDVPTDFPVGTSVVSVSALSHTDASVAFEL